MSGEHNKNTWLEEFLATASPEDRQKMIEFLRDENTYLVDDVSELLTVLEQLRNNGS
jgi:hypothetical protein